MARTTQERRRRSARREGDRERPEQAEEVAEQREGDEQDGGSGGGVVAELRNVASDAALAVLAPVAKEAVTAAAKLAVKKGPELLEDTVKPALDDAGGPAKLVGQLVSGRGEGLMSKLTGGGGDGAGDGTGKGRRMPVQQAVDVAAPIDVVYDQWTQFEDYPKFMHRVQRVEQRDDAHVAFHAKVWGINRMWEAEIVEQRPDERIVFRSVNGVQLTGVVTFHDLAERLTRIELNVDLDPDGPIEKIARGARFVKRATRGDLKRFKAYVEMHEEETGAWRGEIQDGDVVSERDEYDDGYADEDEPEASYDDEPEAGEPNQDDDPPAEAEEVDDEPDEDERPRSRGRRRGSSNGGDPERSARSRGSSSSKSSSGGSGRRRGSSSSKSSGGRSRGSSKSRSSSRSRS